MSLLTGVPRIVRLRLRVAWPALAFAAVGLAGLVLAVARSIVHLYPTLEQRAAYAAASTVAPASAAFNGRWRDLETLGGIVTNEVGFMGLLLVPTVAGLLAVHSTRREEDAGRTEIVTAGRVGRLAPLAAGAVVVGTTMLAFGALAFAALLLVGLPVTGSAWYAASLTLLALAFAALGLLAAEVSRDARTAAGLTLVAVLATFLLRAVVDGANWSTPWVSPSGWLAEARPFGSPTVWPLAAYLLLAGGCLGLAARAALGRDLYGGVVAARPGPERAAPHLRTPTGLAWRLSRGTFLGWAVGLGAWGASLGGLSAEMTRLLRSSPQLMATMGVERAEDLLTGMSAVFAALAASAMLLQGVARLSGEEDSGRLGLLASGRFTRARIWAAWAWVVGAEAIVVIVGHAVVLGLTTWGATGDSANVRAAITSGLTTIPAVLLMGAVGVAARAVVPPAAVLTWGLVGWTAVVGFLAAALGLPTWARRLSPVEAVGRVPVEDPRWAALGAFTVAVVVLVAVSVRAIARRDLRAG